jgi:hypothetical protein
MIEVLSPMGKYKYDTWRILAVKCYIHNYVRLRSCIRNVNNKGGLPRFLWAKTIWASERERENVFRISIANFWIQIKSLNINQIHFWIQTSLNIFQKQKFYTFKSIQFWNSIQNFNREYFRNRTCRDSFQIRVSNEFKSNSNFDESELFLLAL